MSGSVPASKPALFARLVKIEHSVYALPFAYAGAFLAAQGLPSWADLFWITVAMVGARMADGCPSGHGLSGMMQMSVSAFVALAMFFGVGVLVAALVYKRRPS